MVKIALADDHRLFRKSLSLLINTYDNLEVVIEAGTGAQLINAMETVMPDIVLLDIQMPIMNGFETCLQLSTSFPAVKILMLSQIDSSESIYRAMRAGAHGYFTKDSDPENLIQAITSIEKKGFFFQQELGVVLRNFALQDMEEFIKDFKTVKFSEREVEVIHLVCKEFTNVQIAEKLFINSRTVEGHKARIMERLNTKNFIGVIFYALRHDIIKIEDI